MKFYQIDAADTLQLHKAAPQIKGFKFSKMTDDIVEERQPEPVEGGFISGNYKFEKCFVSSMSKAGYKNKNNHTT